MRRPRRLVGFEREVIATPDGDEVVLDHVGGQANGPCLLVLHGLEGSSFSPYVQGFAERALARGWHVAAMNYRGCARDLDDTVTFLPNRTARLYHSGATDDVDLVIRHLQRANPGVPLLAAGVSLGANLILKWLGENPRQTLVGAAAAVCAPYDLLAGARHLESPIGRLYVSHFLETLTKKVATISQRHPEVRNLVDVERALKARDFYTFDDAATAPLHGFADATDYYVRSSSLRVIDRITTPTLALSAVDDPVVPGSQLAEVRRRASESVETVFTPHGGHVGFIGGRRPGRPEYWGEDFVIAWLARQLGV